MPDRIIKVTVDKKPYPFIPTNVSAVFSDIPGTADPEEITDIGLSFTDKATVIHICQSKSTGELVSKEKEIHTFGLKYEGGKIYLISSVLVRQESEMKTETYIFTKDNIWRNIEECPLEEAFSVNIPELSLDQ